jgi:hypothetical protein
VTPVAGLPVRQRTADPGLHLDGDQHRIEHVTADDAPGKTLTARDDLHQTRIRE